MVAPRGMKPQELVFVRRRSFYENASSFGARFYETLLLPPLPYLVTVFPINSHPFDADTAGRNMGARHEAPPLRLFVSKIQALFQSRWDLDAACRAQGIGRRV